MSSSNLYVCKYVCIDCYELRIFSLTVTFKDILDTHPSLDTINILSVIAKQLLLLLQHGDKSMCCRWLNIVGKKKTTKFIERLRVDFEEFVIEK